MIRRELRTAQQRKRNAFTLMEMLVVVAIIVALAGMGGYYFMGQLSESKKDIARTQCKTLAQACETYHMKHGTMPPSLEALKVGTPDSPPLLKKDAPIVDPWGNPYIPEQLPSGEITVFSNGPPGGQPINK